MPPRIVVALIIAFWVGSIAYLIYEDYYPWWRTDAPPPFLIELADEASPLKADWTIYRNGEAVGTASTVMTCLRDDKVELASTIENLSLDIGLPPLSVQVMIIKHQTIQRVNREGQLQNLFSRLHLSLSCLGQRFQFRATVRGFVADGKLHATSRIDSPLGRSDHELEPIPMELGNVLNPMQPIAKVRVRPGQSWRISNVNPLGEVLNLSFQQLIRQVSNGGKGGEKLRVETPKSLLARVDSATRQWTHRGRTATCHIIEYRSADREVTGATWVSVEDGKVLRQEISHFGEKMVMERDD